MVEGSRASPFQHRPKRSGPVCVRIPAHMSASATLHRPATGRQAPASVRTVTLHGRARISMAGGGPGDVSAFVSRVAPAATSPCGGGLSRGFSFDVFCPSMVNDPEVAPLLWTSGVREKESIMADMQRECPEGLRRGPVGLVRSGRSAESLARRESNGGVRRTASTVSGSAPAAPAACGELPCGLPQHRPKAPGAVYAHIAADKLLGGTTREG